MLGWFSDIVGILPAPPELLAMLGTCGIPITSLMSGLVSSGGSTSGRPSTSTSTKPLCPERSLLFSNACGNTLANSVPRHSESVAFLTCSPEHFNRTPRIWIQNEVLVGEMAITTPGPVHPLFPVVLLFRHTMTVAPFWRLSFGCVRGRASRDACSALVVFCLKSACCAADRIELLRANSV